jgi:hypothetical protein
MAENFLFHFMNETQTGLLDVHLTPKILAIVETAAFNEFHEAWEELSAEMLGLLGDPYFYAALSRARGETLSFSASTSSGGKDAVDIGHFLENLRSICEVDPNSTLGIVLNATMTAYDNQFVYRDVGNGTSQEATGMHVTWPLKDEYKKLEDLLYDEIFQVHYNDDAPNWLEFLETFYNSTSPTESSEGSVCLASLSSTIKPAYEGQLLLNPSLEFDPNTGYAIVESEVAIETDMVLVEYGLNLTHRLSTRKLQEKIMNSNPPDTGATGGRSRSRRRRLASHQRRAQEEEDFYYLYGGDVAVAYSGPAATAVWDGFFYYLTAPEVTENIYVYDYGGGLRSFPVCYFSPDNVRSPSDFLGIIDVEEAMNTLGCSEGEVFFTISESGEVKFTLYTKGESGTPSEVPATAGGQIAPVVTIFASVGGVVYDEIVGGFNETVVDWDLDTGLGLLMVPDFFNLEQYGAEYGVIDMYAFDFDNFDSEGWVDLRRFPYFIVSDVDDGSSMGKRGGVRGLKAGH